MPDNTLDNDFIKHIAGDGKIELCLYSQRCKSGMPTWELKIKNNDGTRKIMIVRDYGFEISGEEIKINHFKTRAERNAEISRLYHEEGLSQMFLANIFNVSQPSISLFVNAKNKK